MENRRENRRFKLHQLIEISISKEENLLNVSSIDISVTGIKCKLSKPIKSGSEIYLMFEIPSNNMPHIIKCYGEIAWQKKIDNYYISGINFKDLNKIDKTVLNIFIENKDQ